MTPEITYALAWMALTVLMVWLNLKAGSIFFKKASAFAIVPCVAMAVLILTGIVGVPA